MGRQLILKIVILVVIAALPPFTFGKRVCLTKRNLFIVAVTQFKQCEMQKSVPATFCIDCIKDYLNVLRSYDDLANTMDEKFNDISCAEELSNQNRLNIIPNEFNGIKQLWSDAHCTNCYTDCRPETLPADCIPSAQYKQYAQSQQNLTECIALGHLNEINPCEHCLNAYGNQSTVYEAIRNGNEKVCFDIEDSMNTARKNWQTILNCKRGPSPAPTPATGSSVLPIVFIIVIVGAAAAVLAAYIRKRQTQLDYTRTNGDNASDPSNIFTPGRLMEVLRRNSDL